MIQKSILLLRGPPSSGKSSIARELFRRTTYQVLLNPKDASRLFKSHDKTIRTTHWQGMYLTILEAMLQQGLMPIISEYCDAETRDAVGELGKKYGYIVTIVRCESPYEVLLERYSEKVKSRDTVHSAGFYERTMQRFYDAYTLYQNTHITPDYCIYTSQYTAEENATLIEKFLLGMSS